tara:strand:- start:38 stop:550 length:513 start_codon:yes stop_codon:yes gene_type:complete
MPNRDNKLWAPWRMEHIKRDLSHDTNKCVLCIEVNKLDDRKNLILFRGKFSFIIMNLYPYNNGHLMVCPYRHIASLSKLNKETLSEIMKLISKSSEILRKILNAEGFNIGANIGSVGGAGIDDHLHFHVVPRWKGDTNFMPVVGNTKVIISGLHDTYDELFFHFQKSLAK